MYDYCIPCHLQQSWPEDSDEPRTRRRDSERKRERERDRLTERDREREKLGERICDTA